jgi:osmotically-inducible protein OsmY
MMSKLAAALLVTGLAIAPAASYANDTTKANATNAQAGTSSTQGQSGMTTHSTKAGAAVSDSAITTKVKAKFAADKGVSATNIHVDTDNGVVKLTGTAKSQDEAMKAADIAKATEGVASVDNEIRVGSSGTKY